MSAASTAWSVGSTRPAYGAIHPELAGEMTRSPLFTARSRAVPVRSPRVLRLDPMRQAFHEQLDSVFSDLAGICRMVETAVGDATQALLQGDAEVAERVISGDAAIDGAREKVEDTCFSLLSLQQPVAGDLRVVVSALRMVSELERMGDLSVHVAKIARLRVPEVAVPEQVRQTMTR